jgi:AcrR family transcriptional regulator
MPRAQPTGVIAPAKRTRPPGLSVLHREQIEDSRQRIMKAAETSFLEHSYVATTVDMIITMAGVSRATFYKYFTNRFDVAKGLLGTFHPKILALFDDMPAKPAIGDVRDFLRKLLLLYEENRQVTVLLGEVSGSESDFFPEMIAIHDMLLSHLGQRIPAFRKASSNRPEDARIHVIAHLQIVQLFSFANSVVSKGWKVDVESGIAYLAESLARFIAENDD